MIRRVEFDEGLDELKALPFFENVAIFPKNSINSHLGTGLGAWLQANPQIDRFVVVGDCSDLCTYQAAMHLRLEANALNLSRRVIVPADVVETAVVREIRRLVRAPEIVAQALAAARRETPDLDERDVVAAVDRFTEIWSALFPAEQARIVKLLVERVTVTADGLAVDLRTDGFGTVVREMLAPKPTAVPGEVDTGSPSGTATTREQAIA